MRKLAEMCLAALDGHRYIVESTGPRLRCSIQSFFLSSRPFVDKLRVEQRGRLGVPGDAVWASIGRWDRFANAEGVFFQSFDTKSSRVGDLDQPFTCFRKISIGMFDLKLLIAALLLFGSTAGWVAAQGRIGCASSCSVRIILDNHRASVASACPRRSAVPAQVGRPRAEKTCFGPGNLRWFVV